MSLRVVAGRLRGRRLVAPDGMSTRPTPERVREATFNALEARGLLVGSRVVDLFAGSGAMGIEALSRGAEHATFVDSASEAIGVVRTNVAALGLDDDVNVVRSEAHAFLRTNPGRYDVAFMDPPYAFDGWRELLGLVDADVVVIESDRQVLPTDAVTGVDSDRYEVLRERRYGTTFVTIAQNRISADDDARRKDR